MSLATLVANKVAHVFDDAHHRNTHGIKHGKSLAAIRQSHFLRSRYHHGPRHRTVLCKRQLNVARSWRKVYQQVVELSPAHMVNKMLNHLRHHRATPNSRLIGIRKHAHRNDTDATLRFDGGNRIVFKDFGSAVNTEHKPHGRTINIGIQNSHAGTG